MTTATSELYASGTTLAKTAAPTSNLLIALASALLGIGLRASLATESAAQASDASFVWGM